MNFLGKIFGRENKRDEAPFVLTAPIITDGLTEEGVKPLLDLADRLKKSSNTSVALAESERLKPYFSAMSVYLSKKADEIAPENEKLKKLTTPGALSGVFNAMAACTKNTLTSEVIILPSNIHEGPAQHLFDMGQFDIRFQYRKMPIGFGFVQVFEEDGKDRKRSSTAFPMFVLESSLLKEIASYKPEKVLKDLQAVMTFVNHDMFHHLTSPIINPLVAHKFGGSLLSYYLRKGKPLEKWDRAAVAGYYEDWAHIGHEKTLLAPENAELVESVNASLDGFFTEMRRIAREYIDDGRVMAGDNGKEYEAVSKRACHTVVDYFGTAMAHALTRIFPLDHPVMQKCLGEMYKTDPHPELLDSKYAGDPEAVHIIADYEARGYGISINDELSREGGFEIYKRMKSIQLISLSADDVKPHIPTPGSSSYVALRENSDKNILDMLAAAAKTAGYNPK